MPAPLTLRDFTRRDGVRLFAFALAFAAALGAVLAIGAFLDPFGNDLQRAAGWLLLSTLVVGLLLGWIWRFRPQIWNRSSVAAAHRAAADRRTVSR